MAERGRMDDRGEKELKKEEHHNKESNINPIKFLGFRVHSLKFRRLYDILSINPLYPPLWSSGQSFWLQIQRSRVRFPALPDFLSSSGSGTGSTQPREVN